MELSRKTAKQVEYYVKKLVKAQPSWLKTLFDDDQIVFMMEEDGSMALGVDKSLDEGIKNKAQKLLGAYIEKHPAKFISSKDIFH